MTSNRKKKAKKKPTGVNLMPVIVLLSMIGLILTIYIAYRSSISPRKFFSVSMLALLAGVLFESFRISDNWRDMTYIFIGSYLLSFSCFLPGKGEEYYTFENHMELWPYFFICSLTIATIVFNKDKVTAKLTEGITLLQSLALIYWIVDYGFLNIDSWFSRTLLIIALLFSIFSILNALTHIQLKRSVRLTLSIWSTIIMFAFAMDNIIRVFGNQNIENTQYLSQGLYIGLQFFLLGVSAVYIMHDYMLLATFLPSKNGHYKKDLQENIEDHINRYSDKQIFIGHAFFCILYSVIIYGLNYRYQILPRHTMIWFVFLTFPFVLKLTDKFIVWKNYSKQT